MSSFVAKKEADITAPSQTEHSKRMKELSNKENYNSQIQDLSQAIELKKLQINQLQSLNNRLQEQNQEFSLSQQLNDSRTAYAISLYSKISNIIWDYNDSDFEGGKLVGCEHICDVFSLL
jgi:cell shape-determining protein MreC